MNSAAPPPAAAAGVPAGDEPAGPGRRRPASIRRHLAVLVCAVVAPLAVLACTAVLLLWHMQRAAYHERFQERVSALRLALDVELEASFRALAYIAETRGLDAAVPEPAAMARLDRAAELNPMWSSIGLVRRDGREAVLRVRPGGPETQAADERLDAATFARVLQTGEPAVSDLVRRRGGQLLTTFVAVPVGDAGRVEAVLYAGVPNTSWLAFLGSYPVAKNATLTLNDRGGTIIARTLNNERWAGQAATAAFWSRTAGRFEGGFMTPGLEGHRSYAAFSRSRAASWVLGTGVPQDDVEAALFWPTLLTGAGVLAALLGAGLAALMAGRRIAGSLTQLERAATQVARLEPPRSHAPLAVREAETVRRALDATGRTLHERDHALGAALANEARFRARAERDSADKDELLAMLAHELRNPLAAVRSASTLLALPQVAPAAAERARRIIDRQVGHLTGIVDGMLDLARLNAGQIVLHRERLDLGAVARQALGDFTHAGRCTHLELSQELAPAPVCADATRLAQVIANLVDNACKYTPEGGRLALRSGVRDGDSWIEVADSGVGIAPELLPRLFDLFSQGERSLDRAQGGLGLGLAVVRRLVELHGGRVWARSDGPDRGATFGIALPAAQEPVAAVPEPAAPTPALAPRRVAIVEDNPDGRETLTALLELQGHAVRGASDGPGGVATLLAERPELALVDLGLPGFDGLELARRVRADPAGAAIRLIALTGYGGEAVRVQALQAGFDEVWVKPIRAGQLEGLFQVREGSTPPGAQAPLPHGAVPPDAPSV